MNERKPPAKLDARLLAQAERMVASSVWASPTTWKRVDDQAVIRGFSRGQFTRRLIEYALDVIEEQARIEASTAVLGAVRRGAQRTARF